MDKLNKLGILSNIFLLLVSGYIYNIGAIDKVSTQWLYFSVINIITSVYIIFTTKNFTPHARLILRNPFTILFFIFLIWGISSAFYAINPNEVIIKSVRWFNCFIGFVNLTFLLIQLKNPVKTIALFLSGFLLFEVLFVYYQYFEIIQLQKYDFSKAYLLRGVTGNKNIASASIIVKLPFLLYLIYTQKNKLVKFLFSAITCLSVYIIIIISSRASYISVICILLFILATYLYFFRGKKNIQFITYPFISFFIALTLSIFSLGYNNSASIGSRIQTINYEDTSTQQRLRYYTHALEHIKNNPILGTGMGNWKIKSIDYDSKEIEGYIVPYHSHNDFLEITAELGIIGFILFFGMFFYIGFNSLKILFKYKNLNFFYLIILLSLGSYFIDSNLNFPHARVVNQINFIAISSIFLVYKSKNK